MGRYVIRRLLAVPLLLLGVSIVTFAIVHLTPGSPVDRLVLADPTIRPADLASLERTLGLDRPVHEQYLGWLGQLVQGDLGLSLTSYRPVRDLIFQRLPNTLLLTTTALGLSLLIAVPLGVVAAVRRNSVFDQTAVVTTTIADAVPSFWLGLLLILFFSVEARNLGLPALPSSGAQSVGDGGLIDRLQHLILPVTTLVVLQVAFWMRYVRGQMLEVLSQDYVRTARAKGLRRGRILFVHAFRNALLPLVTLFGASLPGLFAGATLVEVIFSWPGMGLLAVDAATGRDYTLIMGTVLFLSVLTILANLLADILYAVIDPRISYK